MFRPVYFYDAPTLVRVPITASIQHGAIELKKKGPLLVNSIDVMGVAYGEDGSVAARFSETMNVSVEKDKEAVFRSQDIPYQNYMIKEKLERLNNHSSSHHYRRIEWDPVVWSLLNR